MPSYGCYLLACPRHRRNFAPQCQALPFGKPPSIVAKRLPPSPVSASMCPGQRCRWPAFGEDLITTDPGRPAQTDFSLCWQVSSLRYAAVPTISVPPMKATFPELSWSLHRMRHAANAINDPAYPRIVCPFPARWGKACHKPYIAKCCCRAAPGRLACVQIRSAGNTIRAALRCIDVCEP